LWLTAALGIACGLGAWATDVTTLGFSPLVLAGLAGVDAFIARRAVPSNR
jgi:uncharacterized membrane protein YhiD involved in acid resistance